VTSALTTAAVAQHLADLHRRALQFAQVVNDALGIAHEVCDLAQFGRRSGADPKGHGLALQLARFQANTLSDILN